MTKDAWPVRFATTSDDLDIAYMTQPGEGPPFLVVTPLPCPGRSSSGHIPGVGQFCARFLHTNPCYEFEWRGIGLSSRPKGDIAFDDLVRDITAVAEAIGVPFHLMAFGAACVPTVAYANRHPHHVLSLLLDTPAQRGSIGFQSPSRAFYGEYLARLLRNFYDFPPDVVAREILPLFARDNPFDVVTSWWAAVESVGFGFHAKDFHVPTLLYANPESVEDADAYAQLIPGAQTIIGRSHAYNRVRADAMRATFDQFLGGFPCAGEDPAPARSTNGLTGRELEVLRLLATGKPNRGIAQELVVSVNTVERHITHIYSKIGASNRVEAADWARRNNLY